MRFFKIGDSYFNAEQIASIEPVNMATRLVPGSRISFSDGSCINVPMQVWTAEAMIKSGVAELWDGKTRDEL